MIYGYDLMADYIYSNFKCNDCVMCVGKLKNNSEIEVIELIRI